MMFRYLAFCAVGAALAGCAPAPEPWQVGDRSARLLVSRQPALQHGRLTVAAGDLQRRARRMAVASGGTRAARLASSRLYGRTAWPAAPTAGRRRASRCPRRASPCRAGASGKLLDVALGVVVVMPGLRIDPAHRADHLRGEQDVVQRNDLGQQFLTRQVIDAGVEEHVVQQMLGERRQLHVLRDAAEPPPVIRHRAAAVRDDELQRREVLEQVRRSGTA